MPVLSTISAALSGLKASIEGAVGAVDTDGKVDSPEVAAPFWDERQAFKDQLRGSLLQLEGDKFGLVPLNRGPVAIVDGDKLTVRTSANEAPKQRDEAWLSANVNAI